METCGDPAAEPVIYLTIDDVLGIYASLFSCREEEAPDQLRNRSGLASALARPETYAFYQSADFPLQAAALAHGISEGQHFVEGNKRIALVAMLTFLRVNDRDVIATPEQLMTWILDLSAGLTVEELAAKIRPCIVERAR
jgi:death-on-curing protein